MSKELKQIRGQLRQITQEVLPEVMNQELTQKISTDLLGVLNERLDKIETFCKGQLETMDKRAKAVQGFMTQQVVSDVSSRLYENQVTVDAIIRVLADSGIQIENLNEKILAKKAMIKQENEEKLKAELAEKRKGEQSEQQEQQ